MYTFALSSVVSKYTVNRRFLTWCKICSISRKSAISLFKTGPTCICRTAKSKHKLLLFEVHKSSSIVQVTKVVLSGHVETQTMQTADCADRADCADCAD